MEYEIIIGGPIGPVAASHLPGFSSGTVPTATVLAGTVPDPDDVRAVTDRLRAHGLEPLAVRIGPKHRADESTPAQDRVTPKKVGPDR